MDLKRIELLLHAKVLFLDAQTSHLTPKRGEILELGYGFSGDDASFGATLFKPRRPEPIPKKVWTLTGLSPEQMETGEEVIPFWRNLVAQALELDVKAVVIHYAQFERPFLETLHRECFGDEAAFPWPIVCTQRVAHKLFPELPSRTLRALGGHFGIDLEEQHRSLEHLRATEVIWRHCVEKLGGSPDAPPKERYIVDKQKRLDLPKGPGIYEMVSRAGKILYVGKATSLRDRVNSYFRGQKPTRLKMKELMTQVADVRVTPAETPLEAALLENDRIKELEPPYNISLRQKARKLHFLSAQFEWGEGSAFPWGPFTSDQSFQSLAQLHALATQRLAVDMPYWLRHRPEHLFPALAAMGLVTWAGDTTVTLATLHRLGKRLPTDPPDLDEFQTYVRKKLRQAAWRLHQANWVVQLMDCRVAWELPGDRGYRFLVVEKGQIGERGDGELVSAVYRRRGNRNSRREALDVVTLDRLRILASSLAQQARRGKAVVVQFSPRRRYDATSLLAMAANNHPLNPPEPELEPIDELAETASTDPVSS